jgi:hypothetical protein
VLRFTAALAAGFAEKGFVNQLNDFFRSAAKVGSLLGHKLVQVTLRFFITV